MRSGVHISIQFFSVQITIQQLCLNVQQICQLIKSNNLNAKYFTIRWKFSIEIQMIVFHKIMTDEYSVCSLFHSNAEHLSDENILRSAHHLRTVCSARSI